jgi:enoyl-CoA hydratase/carnithine racemase
VTDAATGAPAETPGVLYERDDDGVVVITLNDPRTKNALSKVVRAQLWDAFRRFEDDDGALVAVLTGAGGAFCSGGHLKEMNADALAIPPHDYFPQLGRNIRVTKPVLAAIEGPAFAGGFLLAQMADIAIAGDTAKLGVTEVKWGRGSPWAVPLLWMIPQRVMLELLMTAEPIDAARAFEIGLLNKVVPQGEALEAARTMARTIAGNAPLSVRAAREMVYMAADMGRKAAWDAADALYQRVYLSEDAQEGPRAFSEKRPPKWLGR